VIVLHAVIPRPADGAAAHGLREHVAGEVSVLYTQGEGRPSISREAVLEHGTRIVRLAKRGPVLPIRYGTAVPDLDELAVVAEENADAWARVLARLAGHCELLVHVDAADADERHRPGESGRDYLRRRTATLQRRARAIEEVEGLLAPWAREVRVLPDGRRIAVLVRQEDAGAARDAVVDAATYDDGLVVTGPWPPFSFCDEVLLP
jgi:hypothetical protein